MNINLLVLPAALTFLAALAWCLTRIEVPKPLEIFTWLGRKSASPEEIRRLNKRLEALKIPVSAEIFTAARTLLVLLLAVVGLITFFDRPLHGAGFLLITPLAWRMPVLLLDLREKKRREGLEKQFPFMLNQVRIYAKAADLNQALKIVPYALQGELGREMRKLSAELEMCPLPEALENFAHRCGFKEAEDFAHVILQGIRSGRNMDRILSNYSKMIHQRRVNKIKQWIKIQPIIMSLLPGAMLIIFILTWIIPLYSNIVLRLKNL